MLLDEISRAPPDDRRPQRRDVQIVEDDNVHAARFDVAIGSHIGRRRRPGESQTTPRLLTGSSI